MKAIGVTIAAGAVVSFFIAIYFLFSAVVNRKPGVHIVRGPLGPPAFFAENLTQAGLRSRRNFFLSLVAFTACIFAGLGVGTATGTLR